MVTHSMHQAANLGNRLIMMHQGQIVRDFRGAERHRLRSDHLLAEFEEIRQREQLDASVAQLLRKAYV
jgi:putative ABC transport system ATP-binding protein